MRALELGLVGLTAAFFVPVGAFFEQPPSEAAAAIRAIAVATAALAERDIAHSCAVRRGGPWRHAARISARGAWGSADDPSAPPGMDACVEMETEEAKALAVVLDGAP